MDQYLESTTVHGFSYISRRNPIWERIFWTCTVLAGFTIAGVLVVDSVDDWNKRQTITTLDSIATPIQEVQFPTVTVCVNEEVPPDNWSYLEKFLNSLAFSGNSSLSAQIRSDVIDGIVTRLLEKMEKKYRSAKDLAVWRINEAELSTKYHRTLVDTAELICNKNFSLSDLRSTIVQNFMTNDNYFTDILQKLFDGKVDLNEADYGLLYAKCKTKCCENFLGLHGNDFFHGIMNSGYFLYSQASIGLGTFLANFANMSIDDKSKGKEWSTFNLESTIKFDTTFEADKCDKISTVDILLHKFFEDLALFIGFSKNEPVSLFDVPSMLGIKEDMADIKTTTIKEAILYSQCNRGTLISAFHSCYSEFWHLYIQQNVEGNTTW